MNANASLRRSKTVSRVGFTPHSAPWLKYATPIGTTDLGYVDPIELHLARLSISVPVKTTLFPMDRPATDDEILSAYHFRGCNAYRG